MELETKLDCASNRSSNSFEGREATAYLFSLFFHELEGLEYGLFPIFRRANCLLQYLMYVQGFLTLERDHIAPLIYLRKIPLPER